MIAHISLLLVRRFEAVGILLLVLRLALGRLPVFAAEAPQFRGRVDDLVLGTQLAL